jgi:hypothetical protein
MSVSVEREARLEPLGEDGGEWRCLVRDASLIEYK